MLSVILTPDPSVFDSTFYLLLQLRIRVSKIPLVSLHLRLPAGYPSRDFPEVEIKAPGLAHTARGDLRQGTGTDTQDERENRGTGNETRDGSKCVFECLTPACLYRLLGHLPPVFRESSFEVLLRVIAALLLSAVQLVIIAVCSSAVRVRVLK